MDVRLFVLLLDRERLGSFVSFSTTERMDPGSFYCGAGSFLSGSSHGDETTRYTAHNMASVFETPPSHGTYPRTLDPLTAVNQKLDRILSLFIGQKAVIEKGA